jgi:Spy/CpxP family protein refolding chaperone
MKNQVVKFIALCAIVCGVTVANAQSTSTQQSKMTPEQRSEMRLNKMKTDLNLTSDQSTRVKALLDAEANARSSGDRQAMKTSHENMKTEMGKILTPDQMTKYNDMVAKQRSRMGNHAPGN